MLHKKLKLSTLILFGLGLTCLQAQEALPATGGNATGSGGSVSYSVGQVIYTAHTGENGSVSQGIQQTFDISVVTAVKEANGINLSAYPNPVADFLTLSTNESGFSNLSYLLYDMGGNLLKSETFAGNKTHIATNNLVPATYFLKIIQGSKEIKTFKIIKK